MSQFTSGSRYSRSIFPDNSVEYVMLFAGLLDQIFHVDTLSA